MFLAVIVSATSDAIFEILTIRRLDFWDLNGKPWGRRLAAIATWSISGAIGASVSAIGINSIIDPDNASRGWRWMPEKVSMVTGIMLVPLTITSLWCISYFTHYALGPMGVRSGFAEIRKSLTSSPDTDVSTGFAVLEFSHILKANPYRYPNYSYVDFQLSPDEKMAVVLEGHGKNGSQLAVFDIASGDRITTLGQPLIRHERASFIWSRNAEYLILRTRGTPLETGRYVRYETKLTLFKFPDYEQVAEWQSSQGMCQNEGVYRSNMIENDAGDLVVLCYSQNSGNVTAPLAITISIPALNLRHSREYFDAEKGARRDRLVKLGSAVYAPLQQRQGDKRFVFADISGHENNIVFDDPLKEDRGGDLTFQGFTTDENKPERIGLRFCGAIGMVTNPPEKTTKAAWGPAFCRVLNYQRGSGSFLGYEDKPETRVTRQVQNPQEFAIDYGQWVFVGVVDKASKTGELIVRDAQNTADIQTVTSRTQTPITTSPANGYLFTNRPNEQEIAVYKIKSN